MVIINETDRMYRIELSIDNDGDMLVDAEGSYDSFWIDREQAAQLAEVLKRYSETGCIDE